MAGYFLPPSKGGKKRQCEIVNPDGTPGLWSPPSREERRKAREAAGKANPTPPTPRLSEARSKNWNQGFTFVSAADFMEDTKIVPGQPGVYALFLRNGAELLSLAGTFP